MNLTDFTETQIINHTLRNSSYTPSANIYVALFTSLSNDGQNYTELLGVNGYTRKSVTFNPAVNGASSNTLVQWDPASDDWGKVTHAGIIDNASIGSGNLLAWTELNIPKFIAANSVFTIPAGEMILTMQGSFGLYLRNRLINLIFRNTFFTSPIGVHAALGTVPSSLNASMTEPAGGNYSRKSITFSSPSSSVTSNTGAISWAATGNWGTLTHIGIFDSSVGGNLLYAIQLDDPRTLTPGDGINFGIDDIELTVD